MARRVIAEAVVDVRADLKNLRASLASLDRALRPTEQSVSRLRRAFQNIRLPGGLRSALSGLSGPIRAAINATNRLREAWRRVHDAILRARRASRGWGFQRLTAGIMRLAREATRFGASFQMDLEDARARILGFTDSVEEADDLMRRMKQFAINTPFDVPGVAEGTSQLLAYGQAFGVTTDNVLEYMTVIGDAAAVSGATGQQMENVIRILGRVSSRGRPVLRDLNQLTQAFPSLDPLQAIADATGRGRDELTHMFTQPGGLTQLGLEGTDFVNIFLKAMEDMEGAAGAMDRRMQTLRGTMEKFRNAVGIAAADGLTPLWEALQQLISTPLVNPLGEVFAGIAGVPGIMTGVLGAINPLQVALNVLFEALGDLLGEIVNELAPVLPMLVVSLGEVFRALIPAAPAIAALAEMFALALLHLAPLIEGLAKFASVVLEFLVEKLSPQALGALSAAFLVLWFAMSGPIGPVMTGIIALVALIASNWDRIMERTETLRRVFSAVWEAIWDKIGGVVRGIRDIIVTVFEWIWNFLFGNSIIPDMYEAFVKYFNLIWGVVETVVGAIRDFFKAAWEAIWNVVEPALDIIETVIRTYFNIYKAIFEFYFNLYKTIILTAWAIIQKVVETAVKVISAVVEFYFNLYKTIITNTINAAKWVIERVWNGIRTFLSGVWRGIQATARTVWSLIEIAILGPIRFVRDTIKLIVDTIKGWLSFAGVRDSVANVWEGIKNAILGPIRSARDAVKGIVDEIGGFLSNIPGAGVVGGAVRGVGGFVGRLNPFGNADGQIVRRPGVGLVGEAGPEAIIPLTRPGRALELMRQSGLDRLAGASGRGGGALVEMNGVTIQDATDADLVAQRFVASMKVLL